MESATGLARTQLVGFVLWRSGLVLVAGYSFFRIARWVVSFVELPTQLEIGGALLLAGVGFFLASLIAERIQDARSEGDLSA
ncbi:MAG: hypothetical protein CMJ89_12150 [Planctomycetes bacterium]|jgi:hypothetical protein|nr:hypothetical protein [Planctomycetota bacterium]